MRHSQALLALAAWLVVASLAAAAGPPPPLYEFRKDHDPDGIGKFYMGREIAHVMGHPAADWLERPEREQGGAAPTSC